MTINPGPQTPAPAGQGRFADLRMRVISSAVLGLYALLVLWLGGWWLSLSFAAAGAIMAWEFRRVWMGSAQLVSLELWAMAGGSAVTIVVAQHFGLLWALIPLGLAIAGLAVQRGAGWLAMSVATAYGGLALAAMVSMRGADMAGFVLVLWLILTVMASDLGGYFIGRTVGGPKLWRRLSPSKTWSGTIGGWGLAALAGLVFALLQPDWPVGATVMQGMGLALAAQAGDLLESWAKRRGQVKDSGGLLPGHGGLMDRLDGLVMAALVLLVIQQTQG